MQSFDIPETAEKLGFFKLRLCENLFLLVFHWELNKSKLSFFFESLGNV